MRLTIPSEVMTLKNPRVVDRWSCCRRNGVVAKNSYEQRRLALGTLGFGSIYWDKLSVISTDILKITDEGSLPDFEVFCVDYDIPTHSRCLERRRATETLRRLGLVPLSTSQTVILATQTIFSGEVFATCKRLNRSNAVSIPPFHPERPSYFCFGTVHDQGCFHKEYYNFMEREIDVNPKNVRGGRMYLLLDPDASREFNFPLILGVKTS